MISPCAMIEMGAITVDLLSTFYVLEAMLEVLHVL